MIKHIFAGIFAVSFLLINAYELDAQTPVAGDTTSAEYWRQKGFEAKTAGQTDLALKHYLKVLEIASGDWDASLAVARIFFLQGDYQKTIIHYKTALLSDSANTEALYGIGRCSYRLGNFKEAVTWYRRALVFMPGHVPLLEDLSYALVNNNQTADALEVYQKMIRVDSSIAMAWVGAGRIYQMTDRPATAARYLKRALELDSANQEAKSLYQKAKKELAFTAGYQLMYINETEPIDIGSDTAAYNIDAILHRISLSRRVSDRIFLTFSHLTDRSTRAYYQQETEKRWYDQTYFRAMYQSGGHKLGLHLGGSFVENRFTTYGLAWEYGKRIKKIKLVNTLSAGYDYYYYWNQVGHDIVSDQLRFFWGNLVLEGNYKYVNVREIYIPEQDSTLARNPGYHYTLAGKYTFFKNPKVTLGIYHNHRNYEYRASRYWSPQHRKLNGGTMTVHWESPRGIYAYISGNIGEDSDAIAHWEVSGETGYNMKTASISAGAARFYNPWYENLIVYLSFTKRFIK